jgi:hypothetical protein
MLARLSNSAAIWPTRASLISTLGENGACFSYAQRCSHFHFRYRTGVLVVREAGWCARLQLTAYPLGGSNVSESSTSSSGPVSFPSPAELPSLYSLNAIAVAAGTGSVLAGGYCLWRNARNLGDEDGARTAILFGVLGTAIMFASSWYEPEEWNLPGSLYQAAQAGIALLFAHQTQGATMKAHEAAGGSFYSSWRAAGIGLLISLALVAALLAWFGTDVLAA